MKKLIVIICFLFLSSPALALMPIEFTLTDETMFDKDVMCYFSTYNSGNKDDVVNFFTTSETRQVAAPSQQAFFNVLKVHPDTTGKFRVAIDVAGTNYTCTLLKCYFPESAAPSQDELVAHFNLLMGLAGIICASMIAYAFIHSG